MNPTLRNIIGLLVGGAIGMFVNMAIVNSADKLVPMPDEAKTYPEGATMEQMSEITKYNMQFFEAKHFIPPFLAHGLGTLVGALIATMICATHKKTFALLIGGFFLLGGVMAANMFGWPMPFSAIDLVFAYFPMALLGYMIGKPKG